MQNIVLLLCNFKFQKIEVERYSPFQPNEFLFKKHEDKGSSKAEIYAWAVRDVMVKTLSFGINDLTYRDKKLYWKSFGTKEFGA